MITKKTIISIALAALVVGGILYLDSKKVARIPAGSGVDVKTTMNKEEKTKLYSVAKEITTPDGFINTDGKPVTIGEFVGKKVVLLDIWTYSCINCQRTTPYLNAWYEKYKDDGLVIIGLHTPEFEFEKVYQNVLDATNRLQIKYPVVLDNDYSTWNAYQNRFWPRKYLIDIDGYVVYDHIGEGGYEETEKKIKELLAERARVLGENKSDNLDDELAASFVQKEKIASRSPETYFGATRNEYLGNGAPGLAGEFNFTLPKSPSLNTLYLGGKWKIDNEYAEAVSEASIVYKYNSKDIYLVAESDTEVLLEVIQDGKAVVEAKGADVIEGGIVRVKESRLYKLIHNENPGEHTLELRVRGNGLKAYAFTFG